MIHAQVENQPCNYCIFHIKTRNQPVSVSRIFVRHVGRVNGAVYPSSFAPVNYVQFVYPSEATAWGLTWLGSMYYFVIPEASMSG